MNEIPLTYDGPVMGLTTGQKEIVEEFIRLCPYVVMGTNHEEWGIRLASLANLPGQSLKEFYFVTHLRSQKAVNIMGDPRCEIMMIWEHGGELIVQGQGEIVTDPACKRAKWEEHMFQWYPDGPEDENFCLIRLIPEAIRCMIM